MSKKKQNNVTVETKEREADIQNVVEYNQSKCFFQSSLAGLTEDVAIKKLVILANLMAKEMNFLEKDCKFIISYKDLSSVIFSDAYQNIIFNDMVLNSFYESETSELDNVIQCFYDFELCKQPGLHYYINLPKKNPRYRNLTNLINCVEQTIIIDSKKLPKGKINLFEIIERFEYIKIAFAKFKLIDMTFTFNAKFGKNGYLLNSSTIELTMDFLDDSPSRDKKIQEFSISFDLKSDEFVSSNIIKATQKIYPLDEILTYPCFNI